MNSHVLPAGSMSVPIIVYVRGPRARGPEGGGGPIALKILSKPTRAREACALARTRVARLAGPIQLRKMAEEEERPFKAEYAKSSRAGCKQCKGNITKDTLRMAKMVQVGVSVHQRKK